MKKEVVIPGGVEVKMDGDVLAVSGPGGRMERTFRHSRIGIRIEGGAIIIESALERRKMNALVGTWCAHINNMITGVTSGWSMQLKVVYSHFPVKIAAEGDKFVVQNFMGEKKPRIARIPGDATVKVDKDVITVTGMDKETVGQAAANIELATKVRGYDRRIFSDGIYILGKPVPCEPGGGAR